ncbi:MAG: hypothetical protein ACI9XU_000105 [Arenicella sp.]|jgi:hypothetical protein
MTNIDVHSRHMHQWVAVVNPTNRRRLLLACDNCGVVKSENSVLNRCAKPIGQYLITSLMAKTFLTQKIFQ